LLCEDLIFTSRIVETARAQGVAVRAAKTPTELEALARQQPPRFIIVDLGHPGLVIGDLMAALHAACDPAPRVIAYGSHVDTAGLRAAREAGCDPVLPRSKFVEELPKLVAE
jgi:DNA-binding NarL/FixJ family response regulator